MELPTGTERMVHDRVVTKVRVANDPDSVIFDVLESKHVLL